MAECALEISVGISSQAWIVVSTYLGIHQSWPHTSPEGVCPPTLPLHRSNVSPLHGGVADPRTLAAKMPHCQIFSQAVLLKVVTTDPERVLVFTRVTLQ